MKKQFKPIIHFLLSFVLLMTLFPCGVIHADKIDRPFTVNVAVTKGKVYLGQFIEYDKTVMISHSTLEEMLDFQITEAGGNVTFSRTDKEKAEVMFTAEETRSYNNERYYPFAKAMTQLCLSTKVHKSDGYLVVMPVKGVWNLYDELYSAYHNSIYRMNEYRTSVLNHGLSKQVYGAIAIGKNPFVTLKYYTGLANYESYQNALRKIVMPEFDEKMISLEKQNMIAEGMAMTGKGLYSLLDMYHDMTEAIDFKNLEWGAGEFKEVSQSWGKFTGYFSLMKDVMELFQVEDLLKFYTLMCNIDSMDQSVLSSLKAMNSVNFDALETNLHLNSALMDLIAKIENKKGLAWVVLEELSQGTMTVGVGKIYDLSYAEFFIELADKVFSGLDGTNEKIDATWTISANLVIQDAVGRSINRNLRRYDKSFDYESTSQAIKLLRNDMVVYLLAGHNAWVAAETDGMDHSKIKDEMYQKIQRLLDFDEIEFNIYKTSSRSAEDLKYFVDNQTTYTFYFDEKAPVQFKIEGTASNKDPLTEQMFGGYVMSNGSKAVQIGSNTKAAWVNVYDLEGDYEILIYPENASDSPANYSIKLEVDVVEQNIQWKDYLDKDENGTEIYRIPIPLGNDTSDEKSELSMNLEEGQYMIFGKYDYYTYGYDVSKVEVHQTVQEEATLKYLDNQGNPVMEMIVGTSPSYTDFDEMTDWINEMLINEMGATNLTMSSHELTLDGGFEVEIGKVTFDQSKVPVYYFAPVKNFAYNLYGMTTEIQSGYESELDNFLMDGVKYLTAEELQKDSNVLKVRTRNHLYHFTFDDEKTWLRGSTSFGYFRGYPAENHDDAYHSFYIDNYKGTFEEYYQFMVDVYCQKEGELFGGVMGETVETTIAGYPAYFFDVIYHDVKAPEMEFYTQLFYLDLCNGSNITVQDLSTEFYEQYQTSFEEFIQASFQKIEIVE